MPRTKLPRWFYLRPTLRVAKGLLGKHLVRRIGRSVLIGRIVEVEAYLGEKDPASHAFRGRTKRNEVMFGEGGFLYVYFTYGMHHCCNVVTEAAGKGRAVLLRAVEPVDGIGLMRKNRRMQPEGPRTASRTGTSPGMPRAGLRSGNPRAGEVNLTNGPAKLCEAFSIRREQNGTDLLGGEIYLAEDGSAAQVRIIAAPRIGIRNGRDKRWRFFIEGNPFVSSGRRLR